MKERFRAFAEGFAAHVEAPDSRSLESRLAEEVNSWWGDRGRSQRTNSQAAPGKFGHAKEEGTGSRKDSPNEVPTEDGEARIFPRGRSEGGGSGPRVRAKLATVAVYRFLSVDSLRKLRILSPLNQEVVCMWLDYKLRSFLAEALGSEVTLQP